MNSPKSENYLWLTLMSLGTLGAIIFFPLEIKLAAIAGLLGAGVLTFTKFSPANWLQKLQTLSTNRGERSIKSQTPAARQAAARAKARGNFITNDLHLLDIGLIATNRSQGGPALQRTNSLHTDQIAVRPYLRLRLPHNFYERHASLRFLFKDPTGVEIFIHEQESWLTLGEQDVIPTHQMPISNNEKLNHLGEWILEVFLDDRLIAEHNFRISPSIQSRRERLQSDDIDSSTNIPLDELIRDE